MKFIFDFDDVLFDNTKKFKEHMYACLEKCGISRGVSELYYKDVRGNLFSLKDFICTLFARENISKSTEDIYEEIMVSCSLFLNEHLIQVVKELGVSNCFIVTNGEEKFQSDKIERSGISPLFSKIYIVKGTKKDVVKSICIKYPGEKVIFVEDKLKFIDDLDTSSFPYLKTILYNEGGLEKLKTEIRK